MSDRKDDSVADIEYCRNEIAKEVEGAIRLCIYGGDAQRLKPELTAQSVVVILKTRYVPLRIAVGVKLEGFGVAIVECKAYSVHKPLDPNGASVQYILNVTDFIAHNQSKG